MQEIRFVSFKVKRASLEGADRSGEQRQEKNMKSDKPSDGSPRDAVLARLLAEALEAKVPANASGSACPDAEVLAAYAENGLSAHETSRWESHIADCGRCQKVIAAILVSAESLEGAEFKETRSPVSASTRRRSELRPAPLEISRRPKLWHWWVPGLGLAAAVALWFLLHPPVSTSPASPSAAATTATSQSTGQGNTAASSAKPDETQMAQANVPSPPPAVISGGNLRDSEQRPANESADALKKAAPKQEALQNESRKLPESPAVSEVTRADAAPAAKEKDEAAASERETDKKVQSTDALALVPAAPTAVQAPSLQASPEAGQTQSLTRQLDRNARFSGTNQLKALATVASSPVVFGAPDRSELWRVGPGGLIESSSDQGQTWRPQASGVMADLLAGAAPSPKIAWAVGKGGIILRTADGEHWQRITPPTLAPNSAPPDWTAVDARDDLHATVSSRDLHRYATADGGRTWVQQQ